MYGKKRGCEGVALASSRMILARTGAHCLPAPGVLGCSLLNISSWWPHRETNTSGQPQCGSACPLAQYHGVDFVFLSWLCPLVESQEEAVCACVWTHCWCIFLIYKTVFFQGSGENYCGIALKNRYKWNMIIFWVFPGGQIWGLFIHMNVKQYEIQAILILNTGMCCCV